MTDKLRDVTVVVYGLSDEPAVDVQAVVKTPSDAELGEQINRLIHGDKLIRTVLVQVIHQKGAGLNVS